jgi:two-component SAPR family response regulator
VDKESILLQLWPDADKESASALFHTTLYSIRKMLAGCRMENLIAYDKKKYSMNMELVDSDLEKMSRLCRALGQKDESFVYSYRDVLRCYRGEYLGGIACAFSLDQRAYYEQRFLRLSEVAARMCMEKRQWEEAVSLLDVAIGTDPYEEGLYRLLFQCFRETRDVKRARSSFSRLTATLREELGVPPSPEVAEAYRLCLDAGAAQRKKVAV